MGNWASERNIAAAAAVAVKLPPPPGPTLCDLEKRWELQEIRRQAAVPYLWTTGTAVAGAAGWGVTSGLEALGAAPTPAGLVIGGLAAGVTGVAGLAKRRAMAANGRRFVLAGAVSTAWITLSSLSGITWLQLALLGLGGGMLSAGFWRQLRERRADLLAPPPLAIEASPPPPIELIEPGPPDPITRYIRCWGTYVGGKGGPLAESELRGMRRTPIGVEGIVDLFPAKQTLRDANNAIEQVRSGLFLSVDGGDEEPGEEVLFDQPASIDGVRMAANQLRLQIVTKSPVRRSPWFEAPMYAEGKPGTALIGPYVDARGMAPWVLFDKDGVWSGVVIGGTGGGKSSLMDGLALSVRGTGVMNTMFIDPQGGASSPGLRDNASILALGEDRMYAALLALEEIAESLETYMNAHGLSALIPGRPINCPRGCPCGGDRPAGLMVFIDECDQMFGANVPGSSVTLGARCGVLAKRIRKLGAGKVGFSQYSGVKVFGNDEMLRSNMSTKNLVAFRTNSNSAGGLIPGLPVDPKTLPRRPGYGIISGTNTRTAPFRAAWAPRRDKDGDSGAPIFAEELYPRYPEPPLHPIYANAVRRYLGDPKEGARQAQVAAMAKLGKMIDGSYEGRERIAVSGPAEPRQLAAAPAAPVAAPTAGGGPGRLFAVPPPVLLAPPLQLSALSEPERAVVEIMRDGHEATGDIVVAYGEDTGPTRSKVHRTLNSLASKGWVHDGGHGVWKLTGRAQAAIEASAA